MATKLPKGLRQHYKQFHKKVKKRKKKPIEESQKFYFPYEKKK